MFPQNYFPNRFFAPRFWPKLGTVAGPIDLVIEDVTHVHTIDTVVFPLSADTPRDVFNDPYFVTPTGPLFW